ncbi:MAG: hypothetical protein ACT4P7_10985 [Gemmatimonadaceae bacterium]
MTAADLPGAELVDRGLQDLARGVTSVESLLVSIGAPRLRALGIEVPAGLEEPELKLYLALVPQFGNAAHGRYNALVRLLVSFQRAAACAR